MTVRILTGDCRAQMTTFADATFDAIVTDPPYDLTSKSGGGPHGKGLDTPFARARAGATPGGFMGMKWDGTGVAFEPETWRHAFRVLKPGGILVAFGGTRTYHRLASAIEDAGFDVRDMLGWLYGSGFPKGTDKAKIPEQWKGWNTALKPAIEPVCLARKPMEGTLAENLAKWGTGALWIDGCRIPLDDDEEIDVSGCGGIPLRHDVDTPREGRGVPERDPHLGRWPANVMHDGSDDVLRVFPDTLGQKADLLLDPSRHKTQSVYNPMTRGREPSAARTYATSGADFAMKPGARRLDAGSAARFFYCAKADRTDRNAGLEGMPLKQSGMVSNTSGQHMTRRDGGAPKPAANNHPTVKPTALMRWLCKLVTPPGGLILDPFVGSGSTLKGAELEGFSAVGIEQDPAYVAIAQRRVASDAPLLAQVEVA